MGLATTRYFDREPVSDFSSLVQKYGAGDFASPFRSTVPLLSLVEHDWPLFERILAGLGISRHATLHFEFKVDSRQAGGRASQTDAMVMTDSLALAIEAKWTEPRYPTVGERLKRLPRLSTRGRTFSKAEYQAFQRNFVAGWLELLAPHACTTLALDAFGRAVYQTVHRAASACGVAKRPTLVYLHFVPALGSLAAGAATTEQYAADLHHLHALLGHPSGFPFYVVELPLEPTVAFDGVRDLPKRASGTERAVRKALVAVALFRFGDPRVIRIGPA